MSERMKPHQFFQAMGYDSVKKLVKHNNIRRMKDKVELERLIASWELVENMGGIHKAQEHLQKYQSRTEGHILNVRIAVQDYINCTSIAQKRLLNL